MVRRRFRWVRRCLWPAPRDPAEQVLVLDSAQQVLVLEPTRQVATELAAEPSRPSEMLPERQEAATPVSQAPASERTLLYLAA